MLCRMQLKLINMYCNIFTTRVHVQDSGSEEETLRDRIRRKLRGEGKSKDFIVDDASNSEDEEGEQRETKQTDNLSSLRKEAKRLKREYLKKGKQTEGEKEEEEGPEKFTVFNQNYMYMYMTCSNINLSLVFEDEDGNDLMRSYKAELKKYRDKEKSVGKKKSSRRETDTLAMLDSFQKKLTSLAQFTSYDEDDAEKEEKDATEEGSGDKDEDFDDDDISWWVLQLTVTVQTNCDVTLYRVIVLYRMNHRLSFEDQRKKVIDANVKELDRYEIFDPRNPLTKRRREQGKESKGSKKHKQS